LTVPVRNNRFLDVAAYPDRPYHAVNWSHFPSVNDMYFKRDLDQGHDDLQQKEIMVT